MPPTVTFVIPTFHRPDALRATLEAVLAIDYPPGLCDVIVVDNAPDVLTEAVVRGYAGRAIPVSYVAESRGGSARARNHGARVASGEVLVLCDDDILIEPSQVTRQLHTLQRYGNCLVGGNWRFAPSVLEELDRTPFGRYRIRLHDRFSSDPDDRRLDQDCWEVEALAADSLMISRALYWDLGGFDEQFPFAGAEDRDLSIRATQAGYRLIRDDGFRVLHNDQRLTLEQFCLREERSARSAAVLARKHPEAERSRGFAAVNGPIALEDPTRMAVKKLFKLLLTTSPLISLLPRAVRAIERLPLSDRAMERVYAGVVGVHIFRGFRSALAD